MIDEGAINDGMMRFYEAADAMLHLNQGVKSGKEKEKNRQTNLTGKMMESFYGSNRADDER